MSTREWIIIIVGIMIPALIMGIIMTASRKDADERVPGLTKAAVWRWFWLNVAKYAAGFLVFISVMVGIANLLRWLVPKWMGRGFEIVFVVGALSLGAFGMWPDLRYKFRWPVACAIYVSLGALMLAALMLLAKCLILLRAAITF